MKQDRHGRDSPAAVLLLRSTSRSRKMGTDFKSVPSVSVGGVAGHRGAAALIVRAFESGRRILAIERDMGGVRSVAHAQRAPGPLAIGRIANRRTRTVAERDIPEIERIAVVNPGRSVIP